MTLWYLARGAGLSALVLLTAATALGALGTNRGRAANRVLTQYAHRATASLGLAVLVLHVGTILADEYANVGWVGAIVPFRSGYRPLWVAFGTLAVYGFVGVAALGFARGRMAASERGARVWRGLHGLAYVAWFAAMLHGINSGTDTSVTWVRLLYVGCGLAVLTALVARIAGAARPMTTARDTATVRALAGATR